MSTNLRKAQKHIQRASEILNDGWLGFGVNGDDPRKRALESTELPVDTRPNERRPKRHHNWNPQLRFENEVIEQVKKNLEKIQNLNPFKSNLIFSITFVP